MPVRKARKRLSYTYDQQTRWTRRSRPSGAPALWWCCGTRKARARKAWRKDDRLRPLLAEGNAGATRLVALLAAYAPTRLVTSSSVRCAQTLAPYAERAAGSSWRPTRLSEEDATAEGVGEIVDELLHEQGVRRHVHPPSGAARRCSTRWAWTTDRLAPGELRRGAPPQRASSRRSSATDRRSWEGSSATFASTAGPRSPCVHRRPRNRSLPLPTFTVSEPCPAPAGPDTNTGDTK